MSMAAEPGWKLGVTQTVQIDDHSQCGITGLFAATDSQGYVYVLCKCVYTINANSYLIKLSPALDQVIYRITLESQPWGMAVSSAGNVYIGYIDDFGGHIQKMSFDGQSVLYRSSVPGVGSALSADAAGRLYVAGRISQYDEFKPTPGAFQTEPSPLVFRDFNGFVIRLKPDGAIDYATYLSEGDPSAIIADDQGSIYITGSATPDFPVTPGAYRTSGDSFFARLSADGSALVYSTLIDGLWPCCVALDAAGDAVVALHNNLNQNATVIAGINPEGTGVSFSQTIPAGAFALSADKAGKIYALLGASPNYPVTNSLVTCGDRALTVLDTSGNVLQSTYLPHASNYVVVPALLIAGSSVDILSFDGRLQDPVPPLSVTQLSPDEAASTVQLACMGNAADFKFGISPGELISLFGEGLGPAAGTQPEVTMQTGFPSSVADTEVTINGTPVPLLYVQDRQINAVAPWSLQPDDTVEICVLYKTVRTNCLTATVSASHPGVFTSDGYHALARNQDWSINSATNPAKRGEYVTVWATGLGAMSPAQPDGSIVQLPLPVNLLPARLYWFENVYTGVFSPVITLLNPITVQYAGPAPFEVAGVSQINFIADVGGFTLDTGYTQTPCYVYIYVEQ